MINRHEFAQEMKLREHVRKAIKVVKGRRMARLTKELLDEASLRDIVRNILKEGQSGVADSARHDSTGINALEDLLKNSNILSVLEKGYKSLTTDEAQRESYRNHVLVAIEKSLAPEESRKNAGEDAEVDSLVEDLTMLKKRKKLLRNQMKGIRLVSLEKIRLVGIWHTQISKR